MNYESGIKKNLKDTSQHSLILSCLRKVGDIEKIPNTIGRGGRYQIHRGSLSGI